MMSNKCMKIIFVLFIIFKWGICFDISISDEIEEAYRIGSSQTEQSQITYRYNMNKCSSTNEFNCQTGDQCIERTKACDGKEDCKDSSDETPKCREINSKCPDYAFQCDYGACIDGKAKCNGVKDCADNSDEWSSLCSNQTLLPTNVDCPSTKFRCKSGECVNLYAKCDGVVHCKDGSDETVNLCSNIVCPLHSYRCKYGACAHKFAACNKIKDCADNSDENDKMCVTTTTRTYTMPTRQWNINMCVIPDPPSNGKFYIRYANGIKYVNNFAEEGSIISYTCKRNYELSPNIIHYTCSGGRWNPSRLPMCVRKRRFSWWL